jgi:hypothetical protein
MIHILKHRDIQWPTFLPATEYLFNLRVGASPLGLALRSIPVCSPLFERILGLEIAGKHRLHILVSLSEEFAIARFCYIASI